MDEGLRELERAWREEGDTEARLAWLNARLRRGEQLAEFAPSDAAFLLARRRDEGELPTEDLRAAADLGHEAAALACELGPIQGRSPGSWGWLFWGSAERRSGWVGDWSPAAQKRAMLVLARLASAAASVDAPSFEAPRRLIDAFVEWAEEEVGEELVDRCDRELSAAVEEGAYELDPDLVDDWGEGIRRFNDLVQVLNTLPGFAAARPQDRGRFLSYFARGISVHVSEARALSALRRDLLPWLLRPRGQVPERAAALQRTYSPRQRFEQGESLTHPKFGQGEVLRATSKWIEVDFAGERRRLAHGL